MPKYAYKEINFRPDSLRLIAIINSVIEEYTAQGYDLTLRQVYYQLVARDYIPNNERSYKNTGNLINDARLAGLIDWTAIQDRTRNIRQNSHWNSPASIMSSALYSYAIDTRKDQPNYIEVWVEKDALIGIVQQIASTLDVPCFSCRGYVSASEMWSAAQRFIGQDRRERRVILHLGDHDPSGKDMTRDIADRLELFGADVEVQRIALNWDQIDEFNPPPNPAKLSDSRASAYIEEFGTESWELDALEPKVLTNLIRTHVADLTDASLLERASEKERRDKAELELVKDNWHDAVDLLRDAGY